MELESSWLQSINTESKQLSILSCEKNEDIDKKELEVAKIQNEVNTPAIKEEVIEALATVHKSMEATHEEFKSFMWKIWLCSPSLFFIRFLFLISVNTKLCFNDNENFLFHVAYIPFTMRLSHNVAY